MYTKLNPYLTLSRRFSKMLLFEEIVPNIKLLKTPFAGVWSGVILIKGQENILIDSGATTEVVDEIVVPALKEEGLTPNDISLLLNSHSHGDHVGGHYRFKEISTAKIACLASSLDKMRDPLKYNKLIRAPFPEYSPPPSATLKGIEPDILINEGELVAGRLRLICTPGHDDDCVCWFDEQTKTLITGDSLQANGTSIQGVGFYQDVQVYRNSIKKLLALDAQNLVSGHDYIPCGSVAIGEKETKWYLETCLNLTYTYDILLKEFQARGITNLPDLATELIKHVGGRIPAFLFLPLFTVSAHLSANTDK